MKKDHFQAFIDYNGRMRQSEIIKKGLQNRIQTRLRV
ncbi:hypothetical protein SUB1607A [Streptococcus uberis 0140J]|uniref:Uncharacterized protein n=1 Tax=Streptococcus uberis (strain ATCC BAA-854 / 0140J) TaxID=218495 RepID=B9DVQ0_STRU0|nr:hypothetical protein SUB1607A [Streptococcus uberis 0140J]